ncbi:MAG TPA: UPF0182 family protein [Ilumatobacter sp.]|nr:UPF0182 family protein [Ilumatobacter sp.]
MLIAAGVIFFMVAVFGRAIAAFYVDALWHDALGRDDVFWGQISAKVTLFLMFFAAFALLAGINLYIADRTAPLAFPANVHPYVEKFHEVFGHRLRLVRYGTGMVLAFILALPAISMWQQWLLFRNSKSFGFTDPQFNVDVGFYVFRLPFISFAVDWLFAALFIVLLLTLAAHLLNGGVLFTSSIPTVRSATKIHLAVLIAILAAVKSGDYWLTRYELTSGRRGFVQGATYTVVNAQLPAMMLLTLIAILTGLLYLSTVRTNRWRYPVVASALWLVVSIVGGVIYPSIVESLIVRPNQEEREAPYIARNVAATRVAMGIDDVITEEVSFKPITAEDVATDPEPLANVRLLNPTQMLTRFTIDRGETAGLRITDLDVDRYSLVDGITEQVLVAARELDLGNIANTSWQGEHLVSTRGCGLVMAPVGRLTPADRPEYVTVDLERPELYFGDAISGYAITGTNVQESRCGDDGAYDGQSGVQMNGFLRKAAFALAFLDYNVVGSGAIQSDSQMLWVRSVEERVNKLAPFLDYDTDPYPVVVDGGVQWVLDAYTSTDRFPYAQRIGNVQLSSSTGLSRDSNYIRNSVKAVVDAYTGAVTFYVVDGEDPVLAAWRSAFPDLFTSFDDMPPELRDHLRYPEDLFRVQTELYSKYQIPAEDFFQREGAWSVAQAPGIDRQDTTVAATNESDPDSVAADRTFTTESTAERFTPYYTIFRNGRTGEDEFVILRPFVPFSTDDRRTELQAYMTASSDAETYGELISYVVTDPLPSGPARVADQAETEQEISPELSLQANAETRTRVRFGDLQLFPVAGGLIYIRPVYVATDAVTEYRFVIASHNDSAVLAEDLDTALADLFPGFDGDVVPGDSADDPETPDSSGDDLLTDDVTSLLLEADRVFAEAQQALDDGDLGAYQEAIDRVGELLDQAAATIDQETGQDPDAETGGSATTAPIDTTDS